MLSTRNKEYNNFKYLEGDKIFVKDKGKDQFTFKVTEVTMSRNNMKEGCKTKERKQNQVFYSRRRRKA